MIGCWAAARAACKHDMAQQMQSRPSHLLPSPAGTAGTACTARHSAAGTAHLAAIVRRQPRLVLAVQVILHKNGVVVAHAACISGLFQAGQVSQAAAQRSRQHCSHPPEAHRFRDPPLGRMYVFRSRQHSYSMHCSHQPEGPHLWAGCTCCAPAAPAGSRCHRCARARCRGWGSPSRPCWRPGSSWAAAHRSKRGREAHTQLQVAECHAHASAAWQSESSAASTMQQCPAAGQRGWTVLAAGPWAFQQRRQLAHEQAHDRLACSPMPATPGKPRQRHHAAPAEPAVCQQPEGSLPPSRQSTRCPPKQQRRQNKMHLLIVGIQLRMVVHHGPRRQPLRRVQQVDVHNQLQLAADIQRPGGGQSSRRASSVGPRAAVGGGGRR